MLDRLLVVYVVTLPLIRFELFRFGDKSVVPADLAFGALALTAFVVRGWRRPAQGLLAIASLPLLGVMTTTFTTNTQLSTAGAEVLRTAYSMTTVVAVASLALDRERLRRAVEYWLIAAAGVCILGLLAFLAVVGAGLSPNPLAAADSTNIRFVRVASVLGPNALPLYMAVGLAFAAFLANTAEPGRRKWPTCAMVLTALTALLSVSRGLVGFALTLSLLAFRRELAPDWLHRGRWPAALATFGLFVAGVVATYWVYPLQLGSDQRAKWEAGPARRPTAYGVLHSAGLRMARANPGFGVGPGRFRASLEGFTTVEERMAAWPPLDQVWAPHSAWIGLAAEGGAVLLLSWACLFAWLARRLLEAPTRARCLGAYAGLALIGTLVNGFHVDLIHLKFIWASVGLGLNSILSVEAPVGSTAPHRAT